MKSLRSDVTALTAAAFVWLFAAAVLLGAGLLFFHNNQPHAGNASIILAGCFFVAFLFFLLAAGDLAETGRQIERIRAAGKGED